MKASSYATSISTLSVGLLTTAFLSVDVFADEVERVHRAAMLDKIVQDAREPEARRTAVTALSDQTQPPLLPAMPKWSSCLDETAGSFPSRPPEPEDVELTSDDVAQRLAQSERTHDAFCVRSSDVQLDVHNGFVMVTTPPPSASTRRPRIETDALASDLVEDARAEALRGHAAAEAAGVERRDAMTDATKLRELAVALEIPPSGSSSSVSFEDFNYLVLRVRTKLENLDVRVPFVDRNIRTSYALYALVLVTLGLYALMRNRLRYVFRDHDLGAGEPWLLIDAGVGVEKVLANGWLLFLALAPWIVGATAIASGAGHAWIARQALRSDDASAAHGLPTFGVVVDLALFVAVCVASWASSRIAVSTITGLLQLRYRRRQLEARELQAAADA